MRPLAPPREERGSAEPNRSSIRAPPTEALQPDTVAGLHFIRGHSRGPVGFVAEATMQGIKGRVHHRSRGRLIELRNLAWNTDV